MLVVGTAHAGGFGVGAYGGLNIPVLQDDQGSGKIFGFKFRLKALPFLTLEPNLNFASYGAPEPDDFDAGIDGAKVTSYGVDGTLGSTTPGVGFKPYFVGGIGFYSVSQPDEISEFVEDETNFGFSGGLGFEIGFSPKIGLDVRGKAHIVPIDGGGAAKSLTATAGLNFNF
jgi:opacity protein-like surface antigen